MPESWLLRYSIVTPEKILVEGNAIFVALPAIDGEFGILNNRAPLLVRLRSGIVRVEGGEGQLWFFVAGGFADVLDNHVTVLTPRALRRRDVRPEAPREIREKADRMAVPDDAALRVREDLRREARAMERMLARVER